MQLNAADRLGAASCASRRGARLAAARRSASIAAASPSLLCRCRAAGSGCQDLGSGRQGPEGWGFAWPGGANLAPDLACSGHGPTQMHRGSLLGLSPGNKSCPTGPTASLALHLRALLDGPNPTHPPDVHSWKQAKQALLLFAHNWLHTVILGVMNMRSSEARQA